MSPPQPPALQKVHNKPHPTAMQGQEAASGVSAAGKAVLTQRRGLAEAAAQVEPQAAWLAEVLTQLGLHERVAGPQALRQRPRQQALLSFTLQGLPRLPDAFQVRQPCGPLYP